MRIAVGSDLVHITDFKRSLTSSFKQRVFGREEIAQIEEYKVDPSVRYATTWAAKEAVIKALKQLFAGPLGLKWKDITILRKGKIPTVKVKGARFKRLNFSLSLSHEKDYAIAMVVLF